MRYISALRPVNLILIVFTVLCLRFLLVEPILFTVGQALNEEIVPQLNTLHLILLILSMLLIAAGGYIINDLADIEIDAINKPGKNIIGEVLSKKSATNLYYILTGGGLLAAVITAISVWNYNLAVMQIGVAVSLYFYAFYFKKTFLPGNLIVAGVVAAVPFTYGIYEIVPLQDAYIFIQEDHPEFNFNFLAYWILGFTAFAFLITLTREITKDLEDLEGDMRYGSKSLPATLGISGTKIVLVLLYLIGISGLGYLHLNYLADKNTLIYFSILSLFFIALIILTVLARSASHYGKVSALNKITTLFGVLYTAVVAYMMYNIH